MKQEVNLVGLTQPSAQSNCKTANQLIAYAARVSNPNNQANERTAPKLLSYLIKEDHWSPFEIVSLTMEIKTTRDIGRQILRHRSFAFQEFSQRYAESTDWVDREARLQDDKNRQNSVELGESLSDKELKETWRMKQREVINKSKEVYDWALGSGIAKEQARAILPEGNTMSTLYMAGTLRSWIHYCHLRMGHGTQKEHSEIASLCWDIITTHFPDVAAACEERYSF
jgi:thymidylate synthase (FAD)